MGYEVYDGPIVDDQLAPKRGKHPKLTPAQEEEWRRKYNLPKGAGDSHLANQAPDFVGITGYRDKQAQMANGKPLVIDEPPAQTSKPKYEVYDGEIVDPGSNAPSTFQNVQASTPGRFVQGMRDPIDALAQIAPRAVSGVTSGFGFFPNRVSEFFDSEAKRVDQITSQNEEDYQAARQSIAVDGEPGLDVARFAGNVVSPANLAAASRLPQAVTTGGRIAAGALAGGVGGAFNPVDMAKTKGTFAEQKAKQMGFGAIGGGVVAPIAGMLGDKIAKIIESSAASSPKINAQQAQSLAEKVAKDSGLSWDDMDESARRDVLDTVVNAIRDRKSGLDPAAVARKADFTKEGIPPLLGQITRDPKQFAREKNLRQIPDVGDPLLERMTQQGKALHGKVSEFSRKALEKYPAGEMFTGTLKKYDDDLRKSISASYKAARASAGKDQELPLQGLAQDAADVIDRFGDKVPSGVVNQLRKYGIMPEQAGNPTPRKLFTVESVDDLLHVINSSGSRTDDATNAALSALRASLKKAVSEPGADDVFSGARKLAASRFALQDAVPALKDAARGKTASDDFVNKFIINGKTEDVQGLAKILNKASPEAYKQAREQIGQKLKDAAFGANAAGDKAFAAESYVKAVNALGTDKLKAFFSADEIERIHRLGRIGAYMNSFPNAAPVNTSGNWGAITELAGKIPGMSQAANAALGVYKSVVGGAKNQIDMNRALTAKLPPKLDPETVKRVSKYLPLFSIVGGESVAKPIQ
jgi:hypothetical protein